MRTRWVQVATLLPMRCTILRPEIVCRVEIEEDIDGDVCPMGRSDERHAA
jgi:hypothetical protein